MVTSNSTLYFALTPVSTYKLLGFLATPDITGSLGFTELV
jgi:hypothetical protein